MQPAVTPATVDEVKSLLKRVQEQQLKVQLALGKGELRRQRRETARRLVLGTIFDCLDALARLLRLNGTAVDQRLIPSFDGLLDRVSKLLPPPGARRRTLLGYIRRSDLQQDFYHPAHREAAWELISELECTLLEVGDNEYLRVCLEAERRREENTDDPMRWSNLHSLDKLNDLHERLSKESALADEDQRTLRSKALELLARLYPRRSKEPALTDEDQRTLRNEVVELLARLYQWRSDANREQRAKENLRVVRLRWTCRIFAVALVVAAVLVSYRVADTWRQQVIAVALVVTPAVLGGTLGSVRSLRTEELIYRAGEQPRYRWAFIAQLLVSCTFGLFILVLAALGSLPGLVSPDPPSDPILSVDENYYIVVFYSFLVGLSEPHTLNFAERLMTGGPV